MSNTLLATKFHVPPPGSNLVSRPRLVQRLSEGRACPVTLISAPAGFGKTTLLSEWHHASADGSWRLAWLSLEGADNDPTRFLDSVS